MNVVRVDRNYTETIRIEDSKSLSPIDISQTTIAGSVKFQGIGLHSGRTVKLYVHPAGENSGIVFTDGKIKVAALVSNVTDTARGTSIGRDGVQFRTIEHVMAVLCGLGIDNALVEMIGSETPAMDGSALAYAEAIRDVGMVRLDTPRRSLVLREPITVVSGDSFILAVPSPDFRITYVLNYSHPLIGSQTGSYEIDSKDFATEFASARTFVLYEEVAGLIDQCLAQGGSLDNAIVIWQDRMSCDLRFPDELVRHKVLDLVGDTYLCGAFVQAEILAVRSGHRLNVEFAKALQAVVADRDEMGVW